MFGFVKKYSRRINRSYRRNRLKWQMFKLAHPVKNAICSYGDDLKVFGKISIFYGKRIKIGNRCRLNDQVMLNGRSGITIGDDVTISAGVKIISTEYDLDLFFDTGERIHTEDTPILIGNHAWIGAGAIILPGVKITGEYVIIGAGSVVTKDITDNRVILAGNPAKVIKRK